MLPVVTAGTNSQTISKIITFSGYVSTPFEETETISQSEIKFNLGGIPFLEASNSTISLGVIDDNSTWIGPVAISVNSFTVTWLNFSGTFVGSTLSPNHYNELCVFLANNVDDSAGWKGNEFGFRVSLHDNKIYGYLQTGNNITSDYFSNVYLRDNDNATHSFAIAHLDNTFYWYIDGELKGQEQNVAYYPSQYFLILLTHNWDNSPSENLRMTISDIKVN